MKHSFHPGRLLTLCLALLMLALPVLAMGDAAYTLEVRHISGATGEAVLPTQMQTAAYGAYVGYVPGNPYGQMATHASIQAEDGLTIGSASAGGGLLMPAANVRVTIYYAGSVAKATDEAPAKSVKASRNYSIEDAAVPLAGGDVTVIGGVGSTPAETAPSSDSATVITNQPSSNEPADNNADVNTSATTGKRWWRVSFLDGAGNEMYWINIEEGNTVSWPWDETPYREGKSFAYWWKLNDFDATGHEIPYDFTLPITEDTPILARYYTEDGEVLLDDIPMDSYYSILEDRSEFNPNDLDTYSSILADHSEPPVYTVEDFGSILDDRSDDPLYNVEDYGSILTAHEGEEAPADDTATDDTAQVEDAAASILTAHEESEEAPEEIPAEEGTPAEEDALTEEADPTEETVATEETVPADDPASSILAAPEDETEEAVATYTVTFLNADGSVLDTLAVAEGDVAMWSQPGPVSPDELAFAYWANTQGLEAAYDLSTPVMTDVTLIARYADENGAVILPETAQEETPDAEIDPQQAAASILIDSTAEVIPTPVVTLTYDIGDGPLRVGTQVTIVAHITGIPEDASYAIQWEMNMGEGFEAIPDETGTTYTFTADETNVTYEYRATVTVVNP